MVIVHTLFVITTYENIFFVGTKYKNLCINPLFTIWNVFNVNCVYAMFFV